MTTPEQPDCFVLLDDRTSSRADPRSRLYSECVGTLECGDATAWPVMLDQMQRALVRGAYAVGLFSYELGVDLAGIGHPDNVPLAQVLLFKCCEHLSAEDVDSWLDKQSESEVTPAGIARLQANIGEEEFNAAMAQIRTYIEAGDTYQVNYTYRLRLDAFGSPITLYRRLRERQPVPYGALIALPCGSAVLSFSPELFIRNDGGVLTARPMKGTAQASGDPEADTASAMALATNDKNCAENLMIVDMLRNDLGRIAKVGSVQVSDLFDVKPYGSVLQMTSTVSAQLRPDMTLADIFQAVYPCGSITGAPKHRTMQIIQELEPELRGLYTGAVGWFDAPKNETDIGDFCLSVPIRTLALEPMGSDGIRRGEFGVGAGIVFDSNAKEEYDECQLKARFLSSLPQEFELFETMLALGGGACRHVDLHLQRLSTSAQYFGFDFDEVAIRQAVHKYSADLSEGEHRVRLSLSASGVDLSSAPLLPIAQPVRLLLPAMPATVSGDLFLRHKTSVRRRYDDAWKEAEKLGAFDMLFCNESGELTEGGRSNVFVKLAGKWFTPPLSSGALPGVMRSVLLADPAWDASERVLMVGDLLLAESIVVCNALRGALTATIVHSHVQDKKKSRVA